MLKDWTRSFYQPNGGDPFLFYVVYGSVDLAAPLSPDTYRSNGLPDGLEAMRYTADEHADVVSGFREGYLWEQLLRDEPAFASQIASAGECVVLRGAPSDSQSLNYLRDTVGLLIHFLDHGGVCIYDPQMFQWWKPEDWRKRIFEPAGPVPRHHVVILTSDEDTDQRTWFHTRGMRKFGRPDLSLHEVAPSSHAAVIDLFNRFIEHQAFGAVVPEGQSIRIASLPHGMTCHHAGSLEDPDFNNVHLEIRWPAEA